MKHRKERVEMQSSPPQETSRCHAHPGVEERAGGREREMKETWLKRQNGSQFSTMDSDCVENKRDVLSWFENISK